MNDDDFEQLLAERLQRHDEPASPSLLDASVRRAHGIRRRRQAGAAALAVAVVAGGVWTTHHLTTAPTRVDPAGSRSASAPASRHASQLPTAIPTSLPSAVDPTSTTSVDDSAAAPTCTEANARWSVTEGGTDAGNRIFYVTVQPTSGTCAVRGYPGISLVDANGNLVGAAAERTGPSPERVVATTGRPARAPLTYRTAVAAGSGCSPVQASGVLVQLPGSSSNLTVPLSIPGCSSTSANLLGVDAFSGS